jgi:PAS domain S-box-containing protein
MVAKSVGDELRKKIRELQKKNRNCLRELKTLQNKPARLERRVEPVHPSADSIQISGINIEWQKGKGTCTFENFPVAMMWVDTTLAGLMSGVQAMVGARRFGLALQSEGRRSVEADWEVISRFPDFRQGFKAIANIAAVAGWGDWKLISLDQKKKQCRIQVKDSWEGRYQKTLGVSWGSGMLAGKMAGYASKLFGTNCWADQTAFICKGDEFDEFVVAPSERFIEKEIENLLVTDEATRADMAVALEKLRKEIEERQRASKALRESEAKYRELVQNANSIILRFDTAGRITFFNEFAQRFFGYSENEIIGQNVVGTIVPKQESGGRGLAEMIEDLIRNPEGYRHNENENIKRNGERVWIAWTNKAILDRDGGISQILCIGMDITDRKKIDRALRESEEKYRSLYSSMSEGVALHEINYDEEGRASDYTILDVNPSYESITGIKKETAVGKQASKLYGTGEPPYMDIYAKVAATGRPTSFETYFPPMEKYFGISVFSPGPGKFAAVFDDITERRTAEKETKKLEAQLRQAQKMEAIGTFAGGIAHDFNNILAAIVGYTELALGKTSRNDPLHSDLEEIFRASLRARDLVKQILTFSRQAEQKRQPVQVNLIVKEALKFLRSSLPSSIEIHHNVTGDARVMADPTQIHQVLMNLCANAKHAMRETGGVLEVSLAEVQLDAESAGSHPEAATGPHLKLTVADSGEGMSTELMEKIFEPFFTTKGKEEGTGLGLAMVHGIVKSCGGFITVFSETGLGSIFNVFLPVIDARIKPPAEIKGPLPVGTERVLFVDDEKLLADIGKQMLEHYGYRVTACTSSMEALDRFKAAPNSYDLVVTDMTMPNMSGLGLAREIICRYPNIPVILCTGFSETLKEEGAKAAGIRAFLFKPVALPDLLRTVRKVLDESN